MARLPWEFKVTPLDDADVAYQLHQTSDVLERRFEVGDKIEFEVTSISVTTHKTKKGLDIENEGRGNRESNKDWY